MFELKFTGDNIPRHQCLGVREGDWIIFKCCECNYIRKINLKTKKSTTYGGSLETLHEGTINEMGEKTPPPTFMN